MQKGVISQPGGGGSSSWPGSRPQCTITGRKGSVVVRSDRRVDNATWHTLMCRRLNDTISLFVDGNLDASKTAGTGRLSNNAPVRIGSKSVGSAGGNDQFHGRVDSVFLKIDRR